MSLVKYPGSSIKVRKVVSFDACSPPYEFIVHNSCVINLERAIKERILFIRHDGQWIRPPVPVAGYYNDTLSRFLSKLRKTLPKATPIERSKFADLYTGRKKLSYAIAAASLYVSDIDYRDFRIKAFVKAEKINATTKDNPVPRVIQPCSSRMGVELGRFVKPLEKRIFKAIDRVFGSKTVFKGMNASRSGTALYEKWSRFENPVAVGLDAKRFDQHVHVDALKWEHQVYIDSHHKQRHKRQLRRLLATQLETRGTGYCTDGKVKYRTVGGRCSGHMNTGQGNCLLMCAMVWSYLSQKGINAELANNGDDCVVIMEKERLVEFSTGLYDWFYKMGFQMTVEEPVYDFERIEFCQTHPVFDGKSYLMVRNLQTGLAKDCVSVVYNGTINSLYAYYRGIGDAGTCLTGGIPVWQNFYRRMCHFLPNRKFGKSLQHESGMMNLAKGMKRGFSTPNARTRYSTWLAFNITPDEQVLFETYYDNVVFSWHGMRPSVAREFIQNFPC